MKGLAIKKEVGLKGSEEKGGRKKKHEINQWLESRLKGRRAKERHQERHS